MHDVDVTLAKMDILFPYLFGVFIVYMILQDGLYVLLCAIYIYLLLHYIHVLHKHDEQTLIA